MQYNQNRYADISKTIIEGNPPKGIHLDEVVGVKYPCVRDLKVGQYTYVSKYNDWGFLHAIGVEPGWIIELKDIYTNAYILECRRKKIAIDYEAADKLRITPSPLG